MSQLARLRDEFEVELVFHPHAESRVETLETPGDTFWDKIRSGADAAAERLGVDLKYSNDNAASGQATLVENAVDSGVDGIATTLAYPDAMKGAADKALEAGIRTVGFNQGIDQRNDLGLEMSFGSDETLAGQAVAERLTEEGAGKALCVIQEQGSVALEASVIEDIERAEHRSQH